MQIVVAPGFAGAHGWIDARVIAEAQVHQRFHAGAGDLPDRRAVADGIAAEVVMERARGQLDIGGRTRVEHVMCMGMDRKLDGYLRAEALVRFAVLLEQRRDEEARHLDAAAVDEGDVSVQQRFVFEQAYAAGGVEEVRFDIQRETGDLSHAGRAGW